MVNTFPVPASGYRFKFSDSFLPVCLTGMAGINVSQKPGVTHRMWLFKEPLFKDSLLSSQVLSFGSLRMRQVGCMTLGHLMKTYISDLVSLKIKSNQLLEKVVEEVCGGLEFLEDVLKIVEYLVNGMKNMTMVLSAWLSLLLVAG